MANLAKVFRKYGRIYNGSAEMVNDLFEDALSADDEETMKALIFPGSPVLTAERPPYTESFLHCVCSCDEPNLAIIQLLIEFGANIDKQSDVISETALHIAARKVDASDIHYSLNLKMIRILLKNGANQEIRNDIGLTPIQISLYEGNLDAAEEFLKEEERLPNAIKVDRVKRCRHLVKCLLPKINYLSVSNYSLLLHFLMLEKDLETFEYVANNSEFDVNALNPEGISLLHELVGESGATRFIRALINVGADLDVTSADSNRSGGYNVHVENATPLMIAIKENQIENIHFLLDNGASVHKTQITVEEKNSPLHYAICMQNFEIVEKLLKMGADVNGLTFHRSPLQLACGGIHSRKWPWYQNNTGIRQIYIGEYSQNVYDFPFSAEIVELLLDHGADIEAKNFSNRSPLDQACRSGKLDTVKLLLNRGAKMNQGDVSTLHHAVRGENPAIVKLILEQGANVNHRCAPEKLLRDYLHDYVIPPPRTPLECAIDFIRQDSNCKEIIELLMEYGVNVNVADPVRRETPLHLAYLSNKENNILTRNATSRPETVKLLLESNANVNALDNKGMVPLFYALRNYCATNDVRTSSTPLETDLLALVAWIVKMKETREFLTDENLMLLEDESVRPIYQECANELRLMKNSICESSNFCFSCILFKDLECVGSALKNNKDILQALRDGKYKKKFPFYAGYLEKRLQEVKIRQPRIDLGIVLFHKYINKQILVPLIEQIFHLLNLEDLNNFAKACCLDVE